MAKCFTKEIARQLKSVASVPINKSQGKIGENRFAKKHPRVNPNTKSRLKKQSSTNTSAILICNGPNEIPLVAKVSKK